MTDDVQTQQHDIRPLACALDGGKGNQDGNISYNVMVYHKDPMLCGVGWLADWLVWQHSKGSLRLLEQIARHDDTWTQQHIIYKPQESGAEPRNARASESLYKMVCDWIRDLLNQVCVTCANA